MSEQPSALPQAGPIVVVTGPTASGKTPLAIRLALRFGAEIINADSMQVYRGMDVGTAKPTLEERGLVAHHLIDVVNPDVQYNAGRYAEDARAADGAIRARGKRVILCGGTGLYIRAFLAGLIGGVGSDPELRRQLEEEHARAVEQGDAGALHRRLASVDPEAAERLHPNDLRRIVRALELFETTGLSKSQLGREQGQPHGFRVLHLALDPGRDELRRRIDLRCERMLESGLLQEVRALREAGYGPELASMRAIGYRHMQPVIDGVDTLANVLELMKTDTRKFARRQRTWLRAVPEAVWLHPDREGEIEALVERFFKEEE